MKILDRMHLPRVARPWVVFSIVFSFLHHAAAFAEEAERIVFQYSLPRIPLHLMVEARLNERPCWVILDTGAGKIGVDVSRNDLIGSQIGEVNVVASDGIRRPMKFYHGPRLQLGAASLRKSSAFLTDLRMLSLATGRQITAVIGMEALSTGKIFLNCDERIFQVHSGPWKLNKPHFDEVDLNKNADYVKFAMKILGHPAEFNFDTGSNDCITLDAKVFETLVNEGFIEPAKVDTRNVSIAGERSAKRGWFLKGEFMGKSLAGVSVGSTPGISILGLEWIYGFNSEIDFQLRKLRYQVRRDAQLPGSTQLMIGAILFYDGRGALVTRLRPGGGAAENAGLQAGDVIEEFGNLKAGEMNAVTMGEAVADTAGQEVAVRFLRKSSNGEHVSTKLKLPPTISSWNFAGRDIFNAK